MEFKHEAPSLEEWLIARFAHDSLNNYAGNPYHPSKAAALTAKAAVLEAKVAELKAKADELDENKDIT
jgi:hypothetical protein